MLILTQYYAPEPGAPQIRLRAMVKELRRREIDVRVITGMPNYPQGKIFPAYRGKLSLKDQVDGVPVQRVWLYPAAGRGSLRRLLNYLSFTFTAGVALLLARRSDLVFVEAQPLTLAAPACLLKCLSGVPYVYNTPALQVEYAEQRRWLGGRVLFRIAGMCESFLMRRALTVTTVTQAFIEYFIRHRGLPAAKLSFLPNGVDVEELEPLPRDQEYASEMGVGDRKVFTYAGTHAEYQGLEVLIEAAKLLRHRDDVVILMVGKGPVRERLIESASQAGLDNVLFRDSPFDEMSRLMSITYASLVVLRDMPVARKMRLSKAVPPLACGVPVIYAGPGETAEILADRGCGVVVEPESPAALARAIEELADTPERRRQMGRQGRTVAEQEFSWSLLVDDWLHQLERILAGRDPRAGEGQERP